MPPLFATNVLFEMLFGFVVTPELIFEHTEISYEPGTWKDIWTYLPFTILHKCIHCLDSDNLIVRGDINKYIRSQF